MKHLVILAIGTCLLFTSAPAMADQAADEAAIRAAMEQFNAAYNKHDAKTMGSYFVENVEDWPGNRKGRKQLSEYMRLRRNGTSTSKK